MNNKLKIILLISFLFSLGIFSRTVFHLGPNVEFITAISILSSFYLGRKSSLFLFLAIIFVTDVIIGNSLIFIFTWSGFLIAPVLGSFVNKEESNLSKIVFFETAGILSNLIFFFWTNLGVVLTTTMYEKNIYGLIDSYYNALPFLKNQLGGTLIFIPLIFGVIEIVKSLSSKLHQKSEKLELSGI